MNDVSDLYEHWFLITVKLESFYPTSQCDHLSNILVNVIADVGVEI